MVRELFAMKEAYKEEVEVRLPREIGEVGQQIFASNIINQGVNGSVFAPLSESRIRARKGSEKPILIYKGQGLLDIAHSAKAPEIGEGYIKIPFETTINREGHYFMKYHNEGEGNNPKREFAVENPELTEKVEAKIEESLNRVKNTA